MQPNVLQFVFSTYQQSAQAFLDSVLLWLISNRECSPSPWAGDQRYISDRSYHTSEVLQSAEMLLQSMGIVCRALGLISFIWRLLSEVIEIMNR